MQYDRDQKKNTRLQHERWISFETIVFYIHNGNILDILQNPNYPWQSMIILKINDYVWKIPCLDQEGVRRLITAYPSRDATKKYLS